MVAAAAGDDVRLDCSDVQMQNTLTLSVHCWQDWVSAWIAQQGFAVVAETALVVDLQMLLSVPATATVLVEVVVVKGEAVVSNVSLFAVVAQIPCLLSPVIEGEEVVVKIKVINRPLVVLSKASRHRLWSVDARGPFGQAPTPFDPHGNWRSVIDRQETSWRQHY